MIEQGGFSFCINQDLLTQTDGINIDLSYMGFTVEPNTPFSNAGSSCSSCGSGTCGA